MPTIVFARPEELRRFRLAAGGAADGLEVRRGRLDEAIDRYRAATESVFAVDSGSAGDAVHAVGLALRALGAWVGEVGDAFATVGTDGGVLGLNVATAAGLDGALPAALLVDDDGRPRAAADPDGGKPLLGDGLTVAAAGAAGSGLGPASAERVRAVIGRRTATSVAFASGGRGGIQLPGIARHLDVADALRAAGDEAAGRWRSEPDRPTLERAGRAVVDGALAGVGTYGGSAAGAWLGAAACGPSVVGAVPCIAAGTIAGGWLGRGLAELTSDQLLGDEPVVWEQHPDVIAAEVGDVDEDVVDELGAVVDDAAGDAATRSARHADFVLGHPWTWDDHHADAPSHDPPPPGPVLPRTGPA